MANKPVKAYDRTRFCREMDDLSWGIWPLAFCSVILAAILITITFHPVKELKAERKAQTAVVAMFDMDGKPTAQAKQRKQLAKSILVVKRFRQHSGVQ